MISKVIVRIHTHTKQAAYADTNCGNLATLLESYLFKTIGW